MKLIGNLKKRVDNAADIEEKRSLIEEAGMKLTDDELEKVAGGVFCFPNGGGHGSGNSGGSGSGGISGEDATAGFFDHVKTIY